ncbi:MAG: gp53-like domain-containing protein [Gemmatimonadaceae bacterium]
MMATFVFANFFQTTLASAVTSGATSITVASGTGAPTIAAGQQWAIVVQSAATPSTREVMYVTAVSSTAFTVERGQEGTAALAWSVADNVFCTNTAGQMAAAFETATALGGVLSGTLPNPSIASNVNLPGVPTAATAAIGASSLQLATTAFVNPGESITSPGYTKLPNGLIVQWGEITTTNDVTVSFLIPFPTAALAVLVSESEASSATWGSGIPTGHAVSAISTTGFTHWTLSWSSPGWVSATNSCYYIAIGH